ncbi:diacylglycerol kinase family lipid kinase [Alicyclobacillus fastidiosus]|uniref:Diacylglycerol kinase family lipid kinase n=1 Tax=Alicyclobacillus fastidiosus TaxID=392011 RepID=A0ABY6ZGJ9_9BACL|nr:diacylglycerol kinase family protein [Alicyclobacillus fastidiosus]WAH41987.1 diacylglycerol kinase family lipid kinase [Alicyclobacillus fastidiosus]
MQGAFLIETLFIVNPTAGRGTTKSRWDAFERQLKKYTTFPYKVHFTTRSGEAETVSLQATHSHFERVIAVGGDGTVNEIVNGVLGRDVMIGILPFGTGNDLARSIEANKSDKDLLHMLCYPKEASLNVAKINGRHFINAAGIGFDGIVANHINRHMFIKILGALGYSLSAITVLKSFTPSEVMLNIDGNCVILSHVWMIAIGNGSFYGGGMKICPSAKYDDDLLDVCIVSNLGKMNFLKLLPSVYTGRHVEKETFITTQQGKHIEITCPDYMIAHADGELIASSSLQISVSEKRIRFLT